MRVTAAQLGALLEGLDWRRVHGGRRPIAPQIAGLASILKAALSRLTLVQVRSISRMVSSAQGGWRTRRECNEPNH